VSVFWERGNLWVTDSGGEIRQLWPAIGAALGKAEQGGKPGKQGRTSLASEVREIPAMDRHRFRLLAEHSPCAR
jgi:hypothetical protein